MHAVTEMLLNISFFIYMGTIIPWSSFADPSFGLSVWQYIVLDILVLISKRLPIVLALKWAIPEIKTYREAIFTGWFGPIG